MEEHFTWLCEQLQGHEKEVRKTKMRFNRFYFVLGFCGRSLGKVLLQMHAIIRFVTKHSGIEYISIRESLGFGTLDRLAKDPSPFGFFRESRKLVDGVLLSQQTKYYYHDSGTETQTKATHIPATTIGKKRAP